MKKPGGKTVKKRNIRIILAGFLAIVLAIVLSGHIAKAEPEKHANLIVREGGFSAYFTSLEPGLQDNIIKRTEQQT